MAGCPKVLTQLDSDQIHKYTYDEDKNAQRVIIVSHDEPNEYKNHHSKSEEVKIQTIEVPNIIIQKEIQIVEIPKIEVITQQEIKIIEVEKIIIQKEVEIREIKIPEIIREQSIIDSNKYDLIFKILLIISLLGIFFKIH